MRFFVAIVLIAALGVGFVGVAREEATSCRDRQQGYDALISFTRFLAHEIGATQAQTDKAVADWRAARGPRPTC